MHVERPERKRLRKRRPTDQLSPPPGGPSATETSSVATKTSSVLGDAITSTRAHSPAAEITPGTSLADLTPDPSITDIEPPNKTKRKGQSLLARVFGNPKRKKRETSTQVNNGSSPEGSSDRTTRSEARIVPEVVSSVMEASPYTGSAQQTQESRSSPDTIRKEKGKASLVKMTFTEELDRFERLLEQFTKTVDSLEDLLGVRQVGRGTGLPTAQAVTQTEAFAKKAKITQDALGRLHRSLRSMNSKNARFSIKIVHDFELLVSPFVSQHDYVGLRGTGAGARGEFFYFSLQRHLASPHQHQTSSQEFAVETQKRFTPKPGHTKSHVAPALAAESKALDLEQAAEFKSVATTMPTSAQSSSVTVTLQNSPNAPQYEKWGSVVYEHGGKEWQDDRHMLFKRLRDWYLVGSLDKLLLKPSAPLGDATAPAPVRVDMPLWQRAELATLAASAILYLSVMRQESPGFALGLENFKYYSTSSTKSKSFTTTRNPLILRPYLDVGFGQRRMTPPPHSYYADDDDYDDDDDDSHDTRPPALGPLAQLGLLLYQIIGCAALDFSPQDHSKKALSWAARMKKDCIRRGLSQFVEVADDCVNFSNTTGQSHWTGGTDSGGAGQQQQQPPPDARSKENQALVNKVMRLKELQDKTYNQNTEVGLSTPLPSSQPRSSSRSYYPPSSSRTSRVGGRPVWEK